MVIGDWRLEIGLLKVTSIPRVALHSCLTTSSLAKKKEDVNELVIHFSS